MALSRSDSLYVARRYASALFDISKDGGSLAAVMAELSSFSDLVLNNAELKAVFLNPTISQVEKVAVVQAVLKKAKASDVLTSFISRVAEAGRLEVISDIAEAFSAMVAELDGEVSADIITAGGVDKKEIAAIKKALEKALGKKISANVIEDPEILGGVMVKIGSRLLDFSVKGKLQRLEAALDKQIVSA